MEKQGAINALIAMMNSTWTHLDVRVGAARGLGRISTADVRAELARVMRDDKNHVELRVAAAEALGGAAASSQD